MVQIWGDCPHGGDSRGGAEDPWQDRAADGGEVQTDWDGVGWEKGGNTEEGGHYQHLFLNCTWYITKILHLIYL